MAAKTCESYVIEKLIKVEEENKDLKLEIDCLENEINKLKKVLACFKPVVKSCTYGNSNEMYIMTDYIWDEPYVSTVAEYFNLKVEEEENE